MVKKFNNQNHIKIFNLALGDTTSSKNLNISSNQGLSSSLLSPYLHLNIYEEIQFTKKEEVRVQKFSNLNIENVDLLVLDVQGYELNVIKGFEDKIKELKIIITEINYKELYKNSANVVDIDNFLLKNGFVRSKTKWHAKKYFGDATYINLLYLNKFETIIYKILNKITIKPSFLFLVDLINLDFWEDKIRSKILK